MAMSRFGGHIVHTNTVDHQFTGGNLLQPGNHAQRRRFTAAGRADKNDKLLVLDFEVKILHHVDLVIVNFLNMFQ
jgi:hypothetical protein